MSATAREHSKLHLERGHNVKLDEEKKALLTNTFCAFVSMTTTHPVIAGRVWPVLGEYKDIKISTLRHILLFICDVG